MSFSRYLAIKNVTTVQLKALFTANYILNKEQRRPTTGRTYQSHYRSKQDLCTSLTKRYETKRYKTKKLFIIPQEYCKKTACSHSMVR